MVVATDDGGHILAIYGNFFEEIIRANTEALLPQPIHHAIDLAPGYNLPFGQIYNFWELGGAIFTQLPVL